MQQGGNRPRLRPAAQDAKGRTHYIVWKPAFVLQLSSFSSSSGAAQQKVPKFVESLRTSALRPATQRSIQQVS